MSIFRKKNRPHQPSRQKLDIAISTILDQAVNVDSKKAPAQLRVVLLKENPLWKIPERRVARYLKRHLKARQNPGAEDIVADMDEQTVYTTMSTNTITSSTKEIASSPTSTDTTIPEDDHLEEKEEAVNDDNNEDVVDKVVDEKVDNDSQKGVESTDAELETLKEKVNPNEDEVEDVDAVEVEQTENSKTVPLEEDIVEENMTEAKREIEEVYNDDNIGEKDGMICFGTLCVIS